VSVVCCQVEVSARRADHSSRGVCVVVCDLENFTNEEALAHWRVVAPKTNKTKKKLV
jgi:hypothetical protein